MSKDNSRQRELEYFSWVLGSGLKEYRKRTYEPIMEKLASDVVKYNMVFDILDFRCQHNEKVGRSTRIPFGAVIYLYGKSMYELKQIRHKWMVWANDPNIHHNKVFDGFE